MNLLITSCFLFVLATLTLVLAAFPALRALDERNPFLLIPYIVIVPFLVMIWAMVIDVGIRT